MPSNDKVAAAKPDGRQLRWNQHNEARRKVILDAAVAVIERGEPGAEFHVQQIAEQAQLSRTAIYRHFSDRSDLDQAITTAIVDRAMARLLPEFNLDGTVREIVERIVVAYVDWAAEHPSLHRFFDQTPGGQVVTHGLDHMATAITEVINTVVDVLGLELDPPLRAGIEPLSAALVGAGFGAVRTWIGTEPRVLPQDLLAGILTDAVWSILVEMAGRVGLDLDPSLTISDLLVPVGLLATDG